MYNNIKLKAFSLIILALMIANCSSGGGNAGGNRSEINGFIENLADVQAKTGPVTQRGIYYTLLKFLSVDTANAQVSGITVNAIVDGEVYDTDTTDPGGRFKLNVPEGDVLIQFSTNPTLSLKTSILRNTDISLVLDLDLVSEEVIIQSYQVNSDEISCAGNTNFLFIEPLITRFAVDGNGNKNCIDVNKNCSLLIDIGGRIDLANCKNGISVSGNGNAEIHAGTSSIFAITAGNNGINATDKAIVQLFGFDVDIFGGNIGLFAKNSSFVEINSPVSGNCEIGGGNDTVVDNDASIVDIGNCKEL